MYYKHFYQSDASLNNGYFCAVGAVLMAIMGCQFTSENPIGRCMCMPLTRLQSDTHQCIRN